MESIALLAHRGQEAAGLLLFGDDGSHLIKTMGDLSRVVDDEDFVNAHGRMGVAHIRYATSGNRDVRYAQPFLAPDGATGFVHNGQVDNMANLEARLSPGRALLGDSDGQLLLHTFLANRAGEGAQNVFAAVRATQQAAIGGYACILPIRGEGLLAFRDPWGIRPLVMGEKRDAEGNLIAFASETVALELAGYTDLPAIGAGEAVLVRPDLSVERRVLEARGQHDCAFERIYFSDSSSKDQSGRSFNSIRYELGARLAELAASFLADVDVVVPVPNTPRPAAAGFARASGKPYTDIIYKAASAGRIFITPGQGNRDRKASRAFRYDAEAFVGKGVMIVDDSVIRGTNSREVIRHVRSLGARSVHLAVTWPPVRSPCPYGINMPDRLVARDRSVDELRAQLGADSLTFATTDDVRYALGTDRLCLGCVSGEYPTPLVRLRTRS